MFNTHEILFIEPRRLISLARFLITAYLKLPAKGNNTLKGWINANLRVLYSNYRNRNLNN